MLAAAALVIALGAGCVSIPTSSPVFAGSAEVLPGGSVGMIAQGPTNGQGPEEVLRGFLLAGQAGPTAAAPFALAKEYLTPEAARSWLPMARAVVIDNVASLGISQDENPDIVHATVTGRVVGVVNSGGEYVELQTPENMVLPYTLQRVAGNWRISDLEDGVIVPSKVFTAAYRYTRIYRPTTDGRFWVSEVRWFPQATWRTNAIHALFDGPPAWLLDVVSPAAPENLALALEDIEQGVNGTYLVRVQGRVREASAETRALLRAQIAATLLDEPGATDVTLVDAQGPIPIPDGPLPMVAETRGAALALAQGQVWEVKGRALVPTIGDYAIPEDPTAMAVEYGTSQNVAWRVGSSAIVMAGSDHALFAGENVLAPTADVYGFIWSGEQNGTIVAIDSGGHVVTVSAAWLDNRRVESIRVSPDGARIAVVTRDTDGTRLQVAGIIRNAAWVPIGLAMPLEVGASLLNIGAVAWHDVTTLAVVGTLNANRGVYLVGIGGLDAFGGLPRFVPGLSDPRWVTASVGTGNMLGIDQGNKLHLREAMSLWPVVGQHVEFVAYPG
jgi:hypothetical protein